MSENSIPARAGSVANRPPALRSPAAIAVPKDLAARIAEQTLAKRGEEYASEVRRLLDAALEVIRSCGTSSRPRVADIVTAAGLSNEAFYRHFPSKDSLVAALLEDGTDRLASYLSHQMGKEATPEAQVRRWVEGVLSQTRKEIAATTLAVLWNGGTVGGAGRHNAGAPLGALLHQPFAALGSEDPEMDASLVAHATLGKVSDYLWAEQTPTREEVEYVVAFCLGIATRRASVRS
jgi:AcrR family transcriptional regulator